MTGAARLISRPAHTRRWITALILLAFFFQNLAIQTHIHQPQQPMAVKAQTGNPTKVPLKLDPIGQCRLCQEMVHAGSFVAPSVATSAINLTIVAANPVLFLVSATHPATGFAWQSRAPPAR